MTTIRSDRPGSSDVAASRPTGASRLDQLFALTAATFADRTAVTASNGDLSYRELDSRADAVAGRLRQLGAGPDVVIGLYTTRSTHMVVGLVGIVKSGGAYLPIDPTSPVERVRWLLADSRARIVVTESALLPALSGCAGIVVVIDGAADDMTCGPPGGPASLTPAGYGRDTDLAYVIYTSGSTGTPKGVMVEHASVARLFETTRGWFDFDEHDTWALFHSIAFDFSVWELWGALLHGSRLVVVPHDLARSPADMLALLGNTAISVLNQTPSAFRQLISADRGSSSVDLPALRLVILGGERLDVALLRPWISRRGDERPQLVNMYGITEATVHASYRRIRAADLSRPEISPLGVPLPDLRFLVADPSGVAVDDGQAGELCIAGPGVARGYLGRDDLTAARFSVLHQDGGVRMFRTGDLVAGPQGEAGGDGYVYLGRTDDQIKVRGYRVEPREIEAVLQRHPQVSTSVVTARDYGDGDTRLVAYLVPVACITADASWCRSVQAELDQCVSSELPAFHEAIGLCGAGRAADDGQWQGRPRLATGAATPSAEDLHGVLSPTESEIAQLWRSVIGVNVTSRDDDFFDLGGTSLALVRTFDRVNTMFGTDLAITVLLDGATVARMAASVEAALTAQPDPGEVLHR